MAPLSQRRAALHRSRGATARKLHPAIAQQEVREIPSSREHAEHSKDPQHDGKSARHGLAAASPVAVASAIAPNRNVWCPTKAWIRVASIGENRLGVAD